MSALTQGGKSREASMTVYLDRAASNSVNRKLVGRTKLTVSDSLETTAVFVSGMAWSKMYAKARKRVFPS